MTAAAGLRRMAAQDGVVEACLAAGDRQVGALTPINGWSQLAGSNKASVQFGPYASPIVADRVHVYINGEGPDVISLGSTLRLPAGMPFTIDLSLAITRGRP